MLKLYILFLCSLHLIRIAENSKSTSGLPNIVFIFADDLGWNDVGYHGSNQIPTPNIDALAYSGTILHNYYTQPICTPSRSALMTGRYPINNGMQTDVIYAPEPWGLPLSEKLLPEYLRDLGYINRAIGKWHLGFFKEVYTPTFRGFHSHLGYWLGHKDYYTHLAGEGGFRGYDFRQDMESTWINFGNYSTDLFSEEAEDIIKNHNTDFPLFLYLAHLAVHAPLQAPAEIIDKFSHIKDYNRRVFAAMLTKLDESVGRVMAALKAKGILDNSIIVFASDNGGATHGYDGSAGSNWPLRGCKDTLWEGGVRVPAIIWSPLLTTAPSIHLGMMSVTDWLPTLLSAVNGTFYPEANKAIDGYNQWPTLLGKSKVPYDTLLHNIGGKRGIAALRKGDWKVIRGSSYKGKYNGWYGQENTTEAYDILTVKDSLVTKSAVYTSKLLPDENTILEIRQKNIIKCKNVYKECLPKKSPCLFNIAEDPCEQNNLAESNPELVKELLNFMMTNYQPVPANNKRKDPNSKPVYWNYTWCNWQDYPSPTLSLT